ARRLLAGDRVRGRARRRRRAAARPRLARPRTAMTSEDLYARGVRTMLASWEAYAHGARGACVHRLPGVAAAVFPAGPERDVYNNAVLDGAARDTATHEMEAVYAAAGVARFAAWSHERDGALR